MNEDSRFDHYRQLLNRVDEKFSEIFEKNRPQFQCGRGCFGCCKSGLTVTNVEAEHITSWLHEHPDAVQAIQKAQRKRTFGKEYCSLLSEDGSCLIYDARPIVCRSHGAPILVPSEGDDSELEGDVCPLNFSDFDLSALQQSDWIRLDTLNTILARVDLEFSQQKAGVRQDLNTVFTNLVKAENIDQDLI